MKNATLPSSTPTKRSAVAVVCVCVFVCICVCSFGSNIRQHIVSIYNTPNVNGHYILYCSRCFLQIMHLLNSLFCIRFVLCLSGAVDVVFVFCSVSICVFVCRFSLSVFFLLFHRLPFDIASFAPYPFP